MATHAHLDPSAFFLPGGPAGVLLVHGYAGAPPEMRLIGEYLNARGLTVLGPLLPGHGTRVEDLNRQKWTEWAGAVEVALRELQVHCAPVFIGGLSLGSLLALYTAAHHPELAGAIAYSPAVMVRDWRIHLLPIAKYFVGPQRKSGVSDLNDPQAELRLWSYEADAPAAGHEVLKLQGQVRRLLPQVRCPLLVVYSPCDSVIAANAGAYTLEHAGSRDKQALVLERSGHCVTVDSEWERVAEETYRFIEQHVHH